MIAELLKLYSVDHWIFLNINNKMLKERYPWVVMSLPKVEHKYLWAVDNDIKRLFHLCVSFPSHKDALSWIKTHINLYLNPLHLKLIDHFCYTKEQSNYDIDTIIEKSDDIVLLNFIYATLERALLWYNPESCWPRDFHHILNTGKSIINNIKRVKLTPIESLETKGMYIVSIDEHTHVFYKFQNICLELKNNNIYSELKTVAKQSHAALLKSIDLFFEHKSSPLNEIKFERKLDEIMNLETIWCKTLIENKI